MLRIRDIISPANNYVQDENISSLSPPETKNPVESFGSRYTAYVLRHHEISDHYDGPIAPIGIQLP